jgi:hypothetical protein
MIVSIPEEHWEKFRESIKETVDVLGDKNKT